MLDRDRAVVLDGAKQAFFAALLAGYANDGIVPVAGLVKTKTPDGYKTIEFTTGDYKVVDRYCTTPHSSYSAGTTTISWKDAPVWWMSYGGYYDKEATIIFLKRVLRSTYELRVFMGGRGPENCTDVSADMTYSNNVDPNFHDFERFQGWEEIRDELTGRCLGYHEYMGMSLV
jgi:hypothetical protein